MILKDNRKMHAKTRNEYKRRRRRKSLILSFCSCIVVIIIIYLDFLFLFLLSTFSFYFFAVRKDLSVSLCVAVFFHLCHFALLDIFRVLVLSVLCVFFGDGVAFIAHAVFIWCIHIAVSVLSVGCQQGRMRSEFLFYSDCHEGNSMEDLAAREREKIEQSKTKMERRWNGYCAHFLRSHINTKNRKHATKNRFFLENWWALHLPRLLSILIRFIPFKIK